MQNSKIFTHLSQLTAEPSELIYALTMQDLLAAIARRMGEYALTLTAEELQLARDEVQVAIEHHLDIREYIDMGLDAWEITRNL